jgi:quercetin dioxygenase-like cupin family protein
MIVKSPAEVPYEDTSAYPGVKKKIYIGRNDGSEEIIMRHFTLDSGGATPYHEHPFPHVVKVEKGEGVLIDIDGKETTLVEGQVAYVNDDEKHCFKNTGDGEFSFICIVPSRGEAK